MKHRLGTFKLFLKVSDVSVIKENYHVCCHHSYHPVIHVQNSRLDQTRPLWYRWWAGKASA